MIAHHIVLGMLLKSPRVAELDQAHDTRCHENYDPGQEIDEKQFVSPCIDHSFNRFKGVVVPSNLENPKHPCQANTPQNKEVDGALSGTTAVTTRH